MRLRSTFALPLLLVLLLGLMPSPSAADPLPSPIDCPDHLTVSEVAALPRGTELSGFTVAEGVDPDPFSATLLGVMDDAIAPGRSLIVVEATSPEIDVKGVWAGMSGSPVYYEDQLIGAVAFGMSSGPSRIAGLTAAEDMFELPGATPAATLAASTVRLSTMMTRRIATATDSSTSTVGTSMTQLKLPLAVSGGKRVVERLDRAIQNEDLALLPYGASPSLSAEAEPVELSAGDSLGAGLSFGDITLAAIGTTTFVCDGKAAGFGHPFDWEGPTSMRATGADAIAIVNSTDGAYKLANLTGPAGRVVEDRLAGIVVDLGEGPVGSTVDSETTAVDLNRTNEGQSEVIDQELLPLVAMIHLAANIDSTFDQIGRGSSTVEWTVSGTRSLGEPWTMTRSNRYTSWSDIAFGSVDELFSQLSSLQSNGFESVKITDVDLTASVDKRVRMFRIQKVLSSTNGTVFRDRDVLRVRRGQRMWFKVVLSGLNATPPSNTIMTLRVPRTRSRTAKVRFTAGAPRPSFFDCFFDECPPATPTTSSSFDDLLSELSDKATSDQLSAALLIGGEEKRKRSRLLGHVVRGRDTIRLRIVR